MSGKKYSHYVVFVGAKTGIFNNWIEVSKSISGYSNAKFKGYYNKKEAGKAWDNVQPII